MYTVALLATAVIAVFSVEAFTTSQQHRRSRSSSSIVESRSFNNGRHQFQIKSLSTTLLHATTTLSIPNPLKKLPWNAQKEREREVRRNTIERSKIYRQIGIAEDATYEEIVASTDQLISNAGTNLKQKIQIEIMKDQILQHRLNERLNGLLAQERNTAANREARIMSTYEMDGYVVHICGFVLVCVCFTKKMY
jgi:hypothetical protein